MKLHEVISRAAEDKKFAAELRDLAYRARDEGMKSAAWAELLEHVVETPSDMLAMNTTVGYSQMITATTSKNALLCNVISQITGGTGFAFRPAAVPSTRKSSPRKKTVSKSKPANKPASARAKKSSARGSSK
ncbi:MAG: hypothetical protein ABR598_00320 [Candidatus Dormibacteria bacterium]